MRFHNLVMFFITVSRIVKPTEVFAFIFIKRFLTSLMNALFYQFIFIIVFIFMSFFWRIMVISGDYLCLKCENMKYVCTAVNMTILNSLWQLSQEAKGLHRS